MRSIPVTSLPSAGSGTPTSSSNSDPLASTAGMQNRRAATKASPSSGSSVENTSVAPFSANTAAITSASSPDARPRSSDPATSIAAAPRSRSIRKVSSTALIATESMNSSIEGRSRATTPSTASTAAVTDPNVATTTLDVFCAGSSRSVTSVMTPSVPSLPTNSLVSERPATSLSRGPPSRVGGDVAPDAADLKRRRVGRIPQPVRGGGLLHLRVEQPRLAYRRARHRVDGDVTHLLRRQHDPVVQRRGPARQAAAGPAGHHRHSVGGGPAQHGLHLFRAPRPDDGQRFTGRRVEGAVLAVALGDGWIGDNSPVGQAGDQIRQHISIHAQILSLFQGPGSTANSGARSSSRSDGRPQATNPTARNVTLSPAASASGPATSKPNGPAAYISPVITPTTRPRR